MKTIARFTLDDDHLSERANLPIVRNWTGSRNLPLLRSGEFRHWFDATHEGGQENDK